MKYIKFFYICVLFVMWPFSYTQAAGFFNQEQSISGFGRANAGNVAYGTDSTALFFNPAVMVLLDKAQGYNGSHVLHPRYNFKNTGSTLGAGSVSGGPGQNPFGLETIPNISFTAPINNNDFWLGLGINFPFGLNSKYDNNWFGRYDAIKSSLITVDIQPSIALRLNKKVSIGGGVDLQYMESELTNAVFDTREGLSTLQGDDWTTGYNVGLLLQPAPKLNIGLHYRSEIEHMAKGSVKVEGTASSDLNIDARANLDLPDIISVGAMYKLNEDWRVMGNINWFGWGNFDSLTVTDLNGNLLQQEQQDFNNTYSLSFGFEYDVNEDWVIRSGIQYSQSPSHIRTRGARIPDSNRTWLASGASYQLTEKWVLDMALGYTSFKDANISKPVNSGTGVFNADREGQAFNAELGIKFEF